MNARQFFDKVAEMRNAQKEYFKSRDKSALDEAKRLEKEIDAEIRRNKNDTLYDLLHKMPSCITVDGIDYHFVLKKTVIYMAFYEGEGEGSGKVIFWMAGDPIVLLMSMLKKLKEKGLLDG